MRRTRSSSRATVEPAPSGVALLPDEILLKIFHYTTLTTKIGTIPRVCKKWQRVSRDGQLWKIIEINSTDVTNRKVTKIIQNYAGKHTKVLRIIQPQPSGHFRKTDSCTLSQHVMKVLMKVCSDLEELYLQCLDLRSFSLYYSIPATLRKMYLIDCYYHLRSNEPNPSSSSFARISNHQCLELVETRHSPHVFQSSKSYVTLGQLGSNPKLRYLGLGDIHCLMGGDLEKILPMKQLTHLDINKACRTALFMSSLEKLMKNLPNLQCLDISDCQVSIDGNRSDFDALWRKIWSGTVPKLSLIKLCMLRFINLPSDTFKYWFDLECPFSKRDELKVVGCKVTESVQHNDCALKSILPSPTVYLPV